MSQNQDWSALLGHIEKAFPRFDAIAPEMTSAFGSALETAHGLPQLDDKTKELIAVAVAAAIHCDGCIAYHVAEAKKAGATIEEVGCAISTAMMVGMGSKFIQGIYVMDSYEQIKV